MCRTLQLTYNEIIEALDRKPAKSAPQRQSRDGLIAAIKEFSQIEGIEPTVDAWVARHDRYPNVCNYYRFFDGGFDEAKGLAGFASRKAYRSAFLQDEILRFEREFRRLPIPQDLIDATGFPHPSAFERAFGSVEECIRSLGRVPPVGKSGPEKVWTGEEIRRAVKQQVEDVIAKTGQLIGSGDWDEQNRQPSRATIRRELTLTFNDLLVELGYDPECPSPRHHTDGELIQFLRVFVTELERPPTIASLLERRDRYPNPVTYARRFGSWEKALEQAGFPSNREYCADFLQAEILRYRNEVGRLPTQNELNATEGYPGAQPYVDRWGGVSQCIAAMGLIPPTCGIKGRFSKRVISADGELCDSAEEAFVDDWLARHGVPHGRQARYPYHPILNPKGMRRADFSCLDPMDRPVFVEYAGLIGKADYKAKLAEKQRLAEQNGLPLIIIEPRDLRHLDQKLGILARTATPQPLTPVLLPSLPRETDPAWEDCVRLCLESLDCGETTLDVYQRHLGSFIRWFLGSGRLHPHEVTTSDIDIYRDSVRRGDGDPYSPAVLGRIVSLIRSCFDPELPRPVRRQDIAALQERVDSFLAALECRKITKEAYRKDMAGFVRWVVRAGRRQPEEITDDDIETYEQVMIRNDGRPYGDGSRARILSLIRACFGTAKRRSVKKPSHRKRPIN